jgi:hypothetical protein
MGVDLVLGFENICYFMTDDSYIEANKQDWLRPVSRTVTGGYFV